MPRYNVTLTENEIQELKGIIQKEKKGYRIKHAQILNWQFTTADARIKLARLYPETV